MKRVVVVVATLILAFPNPASAERHCTKDTVNGGSYCGNLHHPKKHSARWKEGKRVQPNHSRYLGWSTRNLGDGMTKIAVPVKHKGHTHFHLFKAHR